MDRKIRLFLTLLVLVVVFAGQVSTTATPSSHPGFTMDVLVDGRPLQQYPAAGARYVEALKEREYAIRLHNPLPVRVAVALSVDGLNTIDARRTTATSARKWVIGPHETITISGWQTSMTEARRFHFTSEEGSYAASLGQPDHLGTISAVFFRERVPRPITTVKPSTRPDAAAGAPRQEAPGRESSVRPPRVDAAPAAEAEELAATGFGRRTDHAIRHVFLNLEDTPSASIDIRYEYRTQLVRLGILPAGPEVTDALDRRERARGFTSTFCPEPGVKR